jgi:hypothetical protein
MMTNPRGKSFLSYRRSRLEEAKLLIEAQHEVGVPTWQDLSNLGDAHTEEELRGILASEDTANALVWLTPDFSASDVIQKIELPAIFSRLALKDSFFMVAVAAGGLDYGTAASAVRPEVAIRQPSEWNLRKADGNPISKQEAPRFANFVLRRRLAELQKRGKQSQALNLKLFTRQKPPSTMSDDLILDWTHLFTGRRTAQSNWGDVLLPALSVVSENLVEQNSDKVIHAGGLLSLPAAMALGCSFLAPKRMSVLWEQYTPGRGSAYWSIESHREDCGFAAITEGKDVDATALAVLVSVNSDVTPAFLQSRTGLPKFRAVTSVTRQGPYPHLLDKPAQAIDLAHIIIDEIRIAKAKYHCSESHVFAAIPAGLAFLIGQLLNTMGPIQTYEHIQDTAIGQYEAAARLIPSRLTH